MPLKGLSPEWSLILAACSPATLSQRVEFVRPLLSQPQDWNTVLHLADKHGTLPLLWEVLAEQRSMISADAMRRMQLAQQQNLLKSLLLSRELIRIVSRLGEIGIEVIPYKGPALAELVYRDVARRRAGDIDLLIRPDDLERVQDAVRGLGYNAHMQLSEFELKAYLQSGYEMSFDGEGGPNLLEVQWAIQPNFYAIDFDMDGLFKRAISIQVAGQPMKTLSPEDLVLVLSAHAAKHMWAKLLWLCDLARLTSFELDWKWIGAQAKDKGITRILMTTLSLNRNLFETAVPPGAEQNIPKDEGSTELAEEIVEQILSGYECSPESISYFRFVMKLRERRADRMRFLQRLIFTPGPGEWSAVRLPPSLFRLYPIVRLSRLTARLFRLAQRT